MLRALCLSLLLVLPARRAGAETVVLAAASLADVMDRLAAEWGGEVAISSAGSAALARQIRQGAPADIFVSANAEWMDALQASGDIDPATRRDVAANRLVLVAPAPAAPVALTPGLDLRALLGDGLLSMGTTDSVPAGIYGRAALEHLGLWDQVSDRLAQSDNVRAALAFVARAEAPLGITYATDAQAEPRVAAIATFPEDSHPPIRYPAARVTGGDDGGFLAFLSSARAAPIWAEYGFGAP